MRSGLFKGVSVKSDSTGTFVNGNVNVIIGLPYIYHTKEENHISQPVNGAAHLGPFVLRPP